MTIRAKISFVARQLLPPIIFSLLLRSPRRFPFEGIYSSFEGVSSAGDYESDASLVELQNEADLLLEQLTSRESLAHAHVRSLVTNLFPLLLATAIKKEQRVRVVDFGGGAGSTFLDCLLALPDAKLDYYVVDLLKTLRLGQKIFGNANILNDSTIHFVEHISQVKKADIAYLGSSLQYVDDVANTLFELSNIGPDFVFMTDTFAGDHHAFVTLQVNMAARKMTYRIFQLDELIGWFKDVGYEVIYKSANYQPMHSFDNFPEEFRVKDSCNLLFRKVVSPSESG